jgi:hypothetical protein
VRRWLPLIGCIGGLLIGFGLGALGVSTLGALLVAAVTGVGLALAARRRD